MAGFELLVDNYLSKISILNLAKADPNPHIQVTEYINNERK